MVFVTHVVDQWLEREIPQYDIHRCHFNIYYITFKIIYSLKITQNNTCFNASKLSKKLKKLQILIFQSYQDSLVRL